MDRRVRHVLDRLGSEWREPSSVRDLAASVNLRPSRLEHLFKMAVSMSIRDHVRQRRIAEAARLLRETFQRVSEISQSVGFRDPSNFDHAFRRETGVSPREYRKRAHAQTEPNEQMSAGADPGEYD